MEQPPPRGCVLKLLIWQNAKANLPAAASARLCVETSFAATAISFATAAASARLCVETAVLPLTV